MNNNLLIVGAGIYGIVARETAESSRIYDKIDFIDDSATQALDGTAVIGRFSDIPRLTKEYGSAIVAVGNPEARVALTDRLKSDFDCRIVSLISSRAYVSPRAIVSEGAIIEPFAVVHAGCILDRCVIISASAIVNHASRCSEGVHVDCGAVVQGYTLVPRAIKVPAGTIYVGERTDPSALFTEINAAKAAFPCSRTIPHGPLPINGNEYSFEDGM